MSHDKVREREVPSLSIMYSVKLRVTHTGAWTNLIIHRHFLLDSHVYDAHIQSEGKQSLEMRMTAVGPGSDPTDEQLTTELSETTLAPDEFTPLSAEHLHNHGLLIARITKLLQTCDSGMVPHKMLLTRIVCFFPVLYNSNSTSAGFL